MKTAFTEMLGIKHPLVAAPMNFVSDINMVAATCNAGGTGILTFGSRTPKEVRESIRNLRELTDKPFGANVTLFAIYYRESIEIIMEEKVPIFCHSFGNPFKRLAMEKPADMIFMPQVGSLGQALAMERAGADALMLAGFEGGGHQGYISTMVVLPQVTQQVKVPVVASGGFCDGIGLAAALVMGAQGIAMGTRFAATKESPMPDKAKQRMLSASEKEAILDTQFDSFRLRCLKGKKRNHYQWWLRPWELVPTILAEKRIFKIDARQLVPAARGLREGGVHSLMQFVMGMQHLMRGMVEGDEDVAVLPAGQVVGRIKDIPTCSEVVERIVTEAEEILATVPAKYGINPSDAK